MTKLKIAAVQAESRAARLDDKWAGADIEHALDLLDEAKRRGADLTCFPELYPLVGENQLCRRAKELGMFVIAGLAQGTRERWYNTSTIISPEGKIVGRQTKNYPTAIEVDNGVVPGSKFEVFETDIGRFGIVICADFAFFNDGVEICRQQAADIIFNPAVWFALSGAYPHTVAGRHMEYSVPVVGVNVARPAAARESAQFPPAGGYTTVCIPPPITDLDTLWEWFRTKPGGIDSTEGFVHTLGPSEEILVVEVDIDAVRLFPGYFSTRKPDRGLSAA
jgi:predicted amidohydrolase